jgi:ABC-type oligopeptide transport system ATPase subunit
MSDLLGIPKIVREGLARLQNPYAHTHVVGGTGKGKTTMLLNIIKILEECGGRIVIVSPDGDLADKAHIQGATYYTKTNPASLNPLTADWLDPYERANILTETLNFVTKIATDEHQKGMFVLMMKILRNCVRIGIKDLKALASFLEYEKDRAWAKGDKYWDEFDRRDHKGFWVNKEQVDSARRVGARISWLTDDLNAYNYLKGQNSFRIPELKRRTIFNFFGFDPALRSFLGTLVLLYVRSHYLHEAIVGGEPLFVIVDEANNFAEENYYKIFPECRKFNIGFVVSFHTFAQLSDRVKELIEVNCDTRIHLQSGRQAVIHIGDKKHQVYTYAPPESTPPLKLNFQRENWIKC